MHSRTLIFKTVGDKKYKYTPYGVYKSDIQTYPLALIHWDKTKNEYTLSLDEWGSPFSYQELFDMARFAKLKTEQVHDKHYDDKSE